jgi:Fe-S cluster biogenesis protein NfuA
MPAADPDAVRLRARAVSQLLASHGGGIEIAGDQPGDVVRLRFTGLCTACPLRPVTLAAIIDPAFRDLPGVTAVEAEGVRFSARAQQRYLASAQPESGTR